MTDQEREIAILRRRTGFLRLMFFTFVASKIITVTFYQPLPFPRTNVNNCYQVTPARQVCVPTEAT